MPEDSKSEEDKDNHEAHLNEKNLAREFKRNLKAVATVDEGVVVAAFDMQKVLLLPHAEASSFYYSRRLRVTNFTMTNIRSMDTHAYMWDETEANKGACEVASMVFDYLKELPDVVHTVHLFSDRCGGQNNNRMMLVMLSFALNCFKFKEITINYLVTGHSQNENDVAHSCIERHSKSKTIYNLDQWETAIQMSFVKNKLCMKRISHRDILDFKDCDNLYPYKDALTKDVLEENQKVYWSKLMQVKFVKSNPLNMFFKYNYFDNEFKCIEFAKFSSTTRKNNFMTFYHPSKLTRRYAEPPGLSGDKKKDLVKLCTKNLIPAHHHAFYENLKIKSN